MSKVHECIDDELAAWIREQHLFFVATAPLSQEGHINCSPKGGDSFRVLGPREVAYLDYTGSGAETAAHLRENGRIIVMFCAFDGKPNIVRLHGHGEVLTPNDARFAELAAQFPPNPGTRALVCVQVARVSTSCGYSIPTFDFRADRDILDRWAIAKGEEGLTEYRATKNAVSIDGLPALSPEQAEGHRWQRTRFPFRVLSSRQIAAPAFPTAPSDGDGQDAYEAGRPGLQSGYHERRQE